MIVIFHHHTFAKITQHSGVYALFSARLKGKEERRGWVKEGRGKEELGKL